MVTLIPAGIKVDRYSQMSLRIQFPETYEFVEPSAICMVGRMRVDDGLDVSITPDNLMTIVATKDAVSILPCNFSLFVINDGNRIVEGNVFVLSNGIPSEDEVFEYVLQQQGSQLIVVSVFGGDTAEQAEQAAEQAEAAKDAAEEAKQEMVEIINNFPLG